MNDGAPPRRPGAALTCRLVAGALIWMFVLLSTGGLVLASAFRDSATQEFGERLDELLRAMIAATEIGEDGEISVKTLGAPRFEDRKSVVEGQSVSVRVDLGGHRLFAQKKSVVLVQ